MSFKPLLSLRRGKDPIPEIMIVCIESKGRVVVSSQGLGWHSPTDRSKEVAAGLRIQVAQNFALG